MPDASYKPDYKGLGEILLSPRVHGLVDLAAIEAIPFAKGISPDAPPYGEGYIASFHADLGRVDNVTRRRGKRAVAYVYNDSDHAIIVENGVPGVQEGHHVLARTVDHIERG